MAIRRHLVWLASSLLLLWTPIANALYWNVFNREGETEGQAAFVTYATLLDMANDENRLDIYLADGNIPFGANIIGSGADIVRSSNPVSEPGALALLCLGLCSLAMRRERRLWTETAAVRRRRVARQRS